ncbi:50S ribosomal protein L1 [Candidatus Bathyarchaeota archaeon]|jgi:large subunit ribosomal protein L1|nr:50S ribosomal protein L1 [Candidatus Bathyarchaeota archaeon]MBT4321529.1 50S ribosomal protein L1 [Candidatus Bathyarchaeota archaeon]MBT4425055.1 50S ribosomal protein L1 [Candidatus Bathyarchaeota archaeon]MBT5642506.1 50S ribosomal protein L1 [Candidatus Bathyarchaeota archaeon]MBT6605260.1 50S ribosomal protein L1 [Candidatus Bathyarchaeota archaeon]
MSLPTNKIKEAVEKVREASPARNFEQSFDLVINLRELDMNRPDNRVNIRFQLPKGIGDRKVLVFASGDLALRSRRAGADDVIEPEELAQLATDKKAAKRRLADYDVFVAEAPMMPTVGRVAGPILGPRGKMPTPVPPQAPIDNILDRERRTIVVRSRDKPFVHCMVGVEGMSDDDVIQNIETVITNLSAATKRGFANIKSMYLKLTMGGSVKLY